MDTNPTFPVQSSAVRPILFVALASIAFSVNDLIFKLMSGTYPLHEMMLIRSAVALALITLFVHLTPDGLRQLKTRHPWMHLARGSLMIVANATQYAALAILPLADATAIYYSAPLLITLFSVILLREHVGPWRWLSVSIGLFGVLLIVKPGGSAYSFAALLSVTSAAVYALSQILTRRLGRHDQAKTMSFYGQAALCVFAASMGLTVGDGSFGDTGNAATEFLLRQWHWPNAMDWFLLVLLGVISAVGGVMMTMAYRDGAPSLVASFEYLALPMSVFWGFIFWKSLPDTWSSLGIAMIVVGGLIVSLREAQLGKKAFSRRNLLG